MTSDDPPSNHITTRHAAASGAAPVGQAVVCPFCGSADTEPMALFGSQLSTAQHYCRACRTPFQRIKHEDARAQ